MAPFITTSESNSDTSGELKHRKKRRKLVHETAHDHPQNGVAKTGKLSRRRWRTETEQQIYSSKLIEALRRSRRTDSPAAKGREVRDTANRVLAVSAKGSTRWSRAILASRVKLRVKKVKSVKSVKAAAAASSDCRLRRRREQERVPAVKRKLRVLGRLVPGCKSAPIVNLLEEASDYIAALEMQVKAMAALTEILGGGGGGRGGGNVFHL